MTLISRKKNAEALDKLMSLHTPDSHRSIVTAQIAGCMHRLGRLESAHDQFTRALEQEKQFSGKRYGQGGEYIEEYCKYFIAVTTSKTDGFANPAKLEEMRKCLQTKMISSELRKYVLPPPIQLANNSEP